MTSSSVPRRRQGPSITGPPYYTEILDSNRQVDLEVDHRFSFGDLLCYPLEKSIERKKFDLKNEVGFYMGDDDLATKNSVYLYRPFYHDLI